VLTSAVAAPALVQMGVEPLAAHMFVFYYSYLATITLRVAVGVYTAAGFAGSDVGAALAPGGGAAAGGAVNFPDLMGLGLVAAFYVLERRREVERVHVQSVV